MSSLDSDLHRAGELLVDNRDQEAIVLLQAVLAQEPAQPLALYLMGLAAGRQAQHAQAVRFFERSLASNPVQPRVLLEMGNAHMAAGDVVSAADAYRRSAGLSAENVSALYNLGMALLRMGQVEEAVDALDDAVEQSPQDWQLRYSLGNALFHLGDAPSAAEELAEALRLNPSSTVAANNLGRVLLHLNRPAEAIEPLRLAAEDVSAVYGSQAALAQALLRAGRAEEALAALEALGRGSHEERAWRLAALHDLGHLDERARLFDAARDVRRLSLPLADGYGDMAAFLAVLADTLRVHPERDWEVPGTGTHGGSQTPPIQVFEGALADLSIVLHRLLAEELEGHRLVCWGTFLETGGHQEPHVHERTSLTGVLFLQVPPSITDADPAGWLELDGNPPGLDQGRQGHRIRPVEGEIVLFPSGVFHRPLPLAAGERISLSFVLVPRD
jgi:tetratricopeptide (TPR) repeat protein